MNVVSGVFNSQFRLSKKPKACEELGFSGSYAPREQTRKSDVDVLVEFEKRHATLHNLVYLADELEVLFKQKVHLLTVGALIQYNCSGIEEEVIWVEV